MDGKVIMIDDMDSEIVVNRFFCESCENDSWMLELESVGKIEDGKLMGIVRASLIATCKKCGHRRNFSTVGFAHGVEPSI